jgi:UDPglucose--hexose-1-phosphate uridylyltransferase
MNEFRRDPLTHDWVAVAGSRQDRPNLPSRDCPFCVGGLEAPQPYFVKAFENRWPMFVPGPPVEMAGDRTEGRGAAEIVLCSPDHEASLATLGREAVRRVVDLWADRTQALLSRPEIEYVLVFENRGELAGATIPHPHGQIYAFPFVPPVPAREALVAETHGCPLCAPIEASDLIVRAADGWRTWVPYASAHPYGLLLAPIPHVADLITLDDAQRDGLATGLVDAIGRYERLFDGPFPYMLWIHQGVHVHVHLAPPLRARRTMRWIAGGELGSGTLTNPLEPERAAAALRDA